jgi:hypothetical protein
VRLPGPASHSWRVSPGRVWQRANRALGGDDGNQHRELLAVSMRGDAKSTWLVALHIGFVGPPASKLGELCTVAVDARDELRAEAGERGMVGHGARDDEVVCAFLTGRPLPIAPWTGSGVPADYEGPH